MQHSFPYITVDSRPAARKCRECSHLPTTPEVDSSRNSSPSVENRQLLALASRSFWRNDLALQNEEVPAIVMLAPQDARLHFLKISRSNKERNMLSWWSKHHDISHQIS